MAQFGWPTLLKSVAITAIVTSAAWVSAGIVWYYRSGPGTMSVAPAQSMTASNAAPAPAGQGGASFYQASAVATPPVKLGLLVMPVVGIDRGKLTDTFTQSRSGGRVHDAIDIMAPRGTPVVAAAPGTVEKLFWSNMGGITAYVRSRDRRIVYYYAHLDAYAPGLAEGQALNAGAPIGTVGFSGNANPAGPHLHFAIQATAPERKWHEQSRAINPYPFLAGSGR